MILKTDFLTFTEIIDAQIFHYDNNTVNWI
jgi:hypothetical protein